MRSSNVLLGLVSFGFAATSFLVGEHTHYQDDLWWGIPAYIVAAMDAVGTPPLVQAFAPVLAWGFLFVAVLPRRPALATMMALLAPIAFFHPLIAFGNLRFA